MKNITNTNNYSHSVGYQDTESEKGKMNYVINPGETIQVPDQHASLFEETEGIVIEDVISDKKEEVKDVSSTAKEKDSADEQKTSKVFTCPTCGIEFGRENVMLEHMSSHKEKQEVKEENGTSSH